MFKVNTNDNHTQILKDFLRNLLKFFIDEADLSLFVNDQHMVIWQKAFTPEVTNPSNNSEDLEYVGDRILKIVFPKYLLMLNPHYTEQDITNMDMAIMEKKTQSDLSSALGLTRFINLVENNVPTTGMGGDVFEAFVGALDEIGELIYKDTGIINCYNMIRFIFNQNKIPNYLREGDIKMNVEQIFLQLGLTIPDIVINQQKQQGKVKYFVSIYLTNEQQEFFNTYNIYINNPLLGTSEGFSKNITIKNAYTQVKNNLLRFGVNEEFINRIKKIREQANLEKKVAIPKIVKERIILDKQQIKLLVVDLLSNILTKEQLKLYTTEENLDIWSDALNNDNNKYKFYGEILVKGLIPKYLVEIHKHDSSYTKEEFNNILSNITKHYNLFVTYPILHDKNNFSSFFGALSYISDKILFGISFINCYNLVKYIFDDKIPKEFSYTHPNTIIDQLFVPFFGKNKGKLILKETNTDNGYTFDIELTPEQLYFLQQEGFKITNRHVGFAEGQLKKQTKRAAYDDAIINLNNYGINQQWATMRKQQMDFEQPDIHIYKKLLDKKNKELGYDYIYFKSPTKTATQEHITIQLLGVTTGGKKEILSSTTESAAVVNKNDAKIYLIKKYLNIK
jgi:dsRNA-specific ribonuclease